MSTKMDVDMARYRAALERIVNFSGAAYYVLDDDTRQIAKDENASDIAVRMEAIAREALKS